MRGLPSIHEGVNTVHTFPEELCGSRWMFSHFLYTYTVVFGDGQATHPNCMDTGCGLRIGIDGTEG